MTAMEQLAELVEWAGKNTAYNLDFIPDDKLDWKPAPEANSALEIVNHVMHPLTAMRAALEGGEFKSDFTPASTRDEAKRILQDAANAYGATLRSVSPENLQGTIQHPTRGAIPMQLAATMPVRDLLHHHGQIAYLQTLLGDAHSHFAP